MSKTVIIKCDICNDHAYKENVDVPVTITTPAPDRNVAPYLANHSLDLCEKCHRHIIDSQPLKGSKLAGGFNKYRFNP